MPLPDGLFKGRQVRDAVENTADKIPSGPMGNVGKGDVIGAAGFFAVESTKPVWQFIPGIKQPGYKIVSHGAKRVEEGEEHVVGVTAISEDVAEWAAQYVAAPSNISFVVSDKEVTDVKETTQRRGYSTYHVTVLLRDPGEVEGEVAGRELDWPR